ncbi:molybdopterin molybdotransferase MoeA [Alkaliphilus hydrothermalis]|uniref:Molybdopterin molybdenumtransferase n=1 Tax=Alkaliphilus hydrothermalis TaxID=1482730 RepID=A0ABS2NQK2_9FIRM|nr:gephyrin-like molybdotransferase Glp [Alkaliphilus hydrothermalis]MBM7614874.1 molybdopterin molybdotransferase [Alkaliphilus hydrothermalis]
MELLSTLSMKEAKEKVRGIFQDLFLKAEEVSIWEAIDRVLAVDVISPINVPEFHRSTVDGYAVLSKDTNGASESLPSFLDIVGEIEMGQEVNLEIKSGNTCYIPTGGMLPKGSDGVVMVEYTELLEEKTVCIQRPVAPLENTLQKGDDLQEGQVVFQKGHQLRSHDIGVLAGMGFATVEVYQKPRISIISTGNELVSLEEELQMGKIRDMNTYSLSAAALQDHAMIVRAIIVKDHFDDLKAMLEKSIEDSDIVLISGGSSMGTKDITKDVINFVGEPGVFIHGIAVKPGKPTIVGKLGNVAVYGLPGQPVSAMVIYQVLVRDLIHSLYGIHKIQPYILGELTVNISSNMGKEHYVMVNLTQEKNKTLVSPVYGKSGMLTMMAKSIGYICIEQNQEGLEKGSNVKVYLF